MVKALKRFILGGSDVTSDPKLSPAATMQLFWTTLHILCSPTLTAVEWKEVKGCARVRACVRESEWVSEWVYVCARARAYVRACVCVCVWLQAWVSESVTAMLLYIYIMTDIV